MISRQNKRMSECEICYEEKNEKIYLRCSHSLCNTCYDRIENNCPFCREPIVEKILEEKKLEAMENDPEYWLEYDNREWVTYSRFLRNGTEIIRVFRKSEIPDSWRNDDLSIVLKRTRQRKRRARNYS